jgi:N-alpha-acetyltransferase 15/16, NatA auxiliary subunit
VRLRIFAQENLNLLNDAANLQTQLRQFDALRDSRELILKLRPNVRRNWLHLALAYQLCGDLAGAKRVLEHYMSIVKVRIILLVLWSIDANHERVECARL